MGKLANSFVALVLMSAPMMAQNAQAIYCDNPAYEQCIWEADMIFEKEKRAAQTEREFRDAKSRHFTLKLGCMKLYL